MPLLRYPVQLFPQLPDFIQQFQRQRNTGHIDTQIALQSFCRAYPVQTETGKTPV